MSRKLRVVYWNNIPAPYMVDRFNALADLGELDFEAWFNDRLETGRSWTVDESAWRFRYRYLPTTQVLGRRLRWPLPSLGRRPDVLVSLYAEPVFVFGWALAKLCRVRTLFWCEVTFDRWVRRRWWKNALKRFMFSRVNATLGPGKDGLAFAMRFGVPRSRALRLQHVIDAAHYRAGSRDALSMRDSARARLGLVGTTFIYVGRLLQKKGLEYLLDAFAVVQQSEAEDVSLLLVGDGSDENRLRELCLARGLKNVVFAGFHQKQDLPKFYAMADVFVFPTLGDPYGLVVDEAMACGLPVISSDAAGEIRDRIEDGVNGFVVPVEDSTALAERMGQLVRDRALRDRMGRVSAEKIKGHTPERWASDFVRIIYQVAGRQTHKNRR